jgi:hypothetical protein
LITALGSMQPQIARDAKGKVTRTIRSPEPFTVPMTQKALKADLEIGRHEVELKRKHEGRDAFTSILARTAEHVRRLALIRAVSRSPHAPQVEEEDMRWGYRVVELSQSLMLPAIEHHVADSPWEASMKKLLNIIRKHGDWIDISTINSRCYFLKARDRNEMLAQLIDGGTLKVKKEETGTKKRTYVMLTSQYEKRHQG